MATRVYRHSSSGKQKGRAVYRPAARYVRSPRRDSKLKRVPTPQWTLGTLLFARPSLWEGIARIFDFGNTLTEYNRSATPHDADARALAADWHVVGEDLRNAITMYDETLIDEQTPVGSAHR